MWAASVVGRIEAAAGLHDHLRRIPVVKIGENAPGDNARTPRRDRGSVILRDGKQMYWSSKILGVLGSILLFCSSDDNIYAT